MKFQYIRTESSRGCEAFVIANQTYLAFANYYNPQQKYGVQSTVFRWSGGRFVKHQSLPTQGACGLHYFEASGHQFLAVANYRSDSSFNINSHIYKWNGTKFVIFQIIASKGAMAWRSFVINGEVFLALANNYGNSQKYAVNSVIYKASGATFVKYQELDTSGASTFCQFAVQSEQFLAVANYYNSNKYDLNIGIYKWL